MQTWHGFSEEEPTFSVNAVLPRLYMFTLLSRAAFIEVLGCSCLSLRSAGEMPRPREGTDSLPGHRAAGVGGPPGGFFDSASPPPFLTVSASESVHTSFRHVFSASYHLYPVPETG